MPTKTKPAPKAKPTAAAPDLLPTRTVPIESVIPYARNPRRNQAAVAKVAGSLTEFGWRQPIVVDAENVIVVGHTRLLAAQQLGMTHVPVHVATGLTPTQIKAYRLADNRVGEEAEWDSDLLALELNDLELDGFAMALTGFGDDEIGRLMGRIDGGAWDSDIAAKVDGIEETDAGIPGKIVVTCEPAETDAIQTACVTPSVAVLLSGEHLCMSMRGVRTPALMRSSVMRGVFKESAAARAEFLSLADGVSTK